VSRSAGLLDVCTARRMWPDCAAFQGRSPNAVVTISNPDDGRAGARNTLSQYTSYIVASGWFFTLHNECVVYIHKQQRKLLVAPSVVNCSA
jgi:hypothetical protein